MLAAGLIVLAVIGSAVIGLILIVFVNRRSWLDPYIVVLRCDGAESEREAADFLKKSVTRCSVKSKTVQPGSVELNVEVRMKGESTDFINALAALPGVQSAVLVSYNGEYMGRGMCYVNQQQFGPHLRCGPGARRTHSGPGFLCAGFGL